MLDPECELCEAARMTEWFYEDEVCWVADCEVCSVPMVVWRRHGTEPPEAEIEHMRTQLSAVATKLFGADGYKLDEVMRQIPDHYHAHARDPNWWRRRSQGW